MSMHCSDNKFDKIKLFYELAKVKWFIEKHAKADAKKEGDNKFHEYLTKLLPDLEKHISELDEMLCRKDVK